MVIAIAGAGIGGLTAALSLHAAGLECVVIEAVRRPRPLGAGINLLPHAVRELSELDLGDDLARTGIPTAEMVHCDRFGNRIWSAPRGLAAGYRWPQYAIHRGELQRILWDAVVSRLGPGAVRTGLSVERFAQTEGVVELELRDRDKGSRSTFLADVLIGADGLHSSVRAQLHPHEGRPRWNGVHMWRGVTEAAPFLGGRSMIVAGSNRRAKFVAYPISRRAEEEGRAAVNWVAEVLLEPGAEVAPSSWNRQSSAAAVLPYFASFRFDWLDVPGLIAGASAIFEYPMVDRDPLPAWGSGRVTLLGDAAHPMYPVGSNGGSQAIVDARVLAWELARSDDPVAALAGYEQARRPATSAMVLSSREMGPERVLATVEERAPHGFTRIEDVLHGDELSSLGATYRALTGSDAESLNRRPSWAPPARRPASGLRAG
jgi:2-polyprenyl-6-methoxyphenol hydroxylase-like FAD-dependent oxidoreductase